MNKALIVTCNDSYDYNTRTRYVEKILNDRGYSVEHLISDFDHRSKKRYSANHPGIIHYIHVPSYSKNISFRRIWSHIRFGQQVKRFVMSNDYDLIYHCAPPNYTIKQLSICKKNKQFRLITEIGDMWPESIPISERLKKILYIPFSIWSGMRDRNLTNSDSVIAECDLFRDNIIRKSRIKKVTTVYFCKEYNGIDRTTKYSYGDPLNLCYLGSINNIIDIETITKLITIIAKRVHIILHIIGDGEKRQELIDAAEKAGAEVQYYGIVYDEIIKKQIFNKCQYALNIMKNNVFVGMTMKSLDYFSAGLPLVNNIGGDIWKMVEYENIGFNIHENNYDDVVDKLLTSTDEEYINLCKAVRQTHQKYFSVECVKEAVSSLIQ